MKKKKPTITFCNLVIWSREGIVWAKQSGVIEYWLSRPHSWVQTLKEGVKSIYSDVAETQPIQTLCHSSMSSVICTVHAQKMWIRCRLTHMNLTWFDWLTIDVSMLYINVMYIFIHSFKKNTKNLGKQKCFFYDITFLTSITCIF